MKIAQINGGAFGSTGKIMFGIANVAKDNGDETFIASPITSTNRYKQPDIDYYKIGTYHGRRFHVLLARITGFNGCFAYFSTKRLIKNLKLFSPNILQLHNLHNSYINLPLLFKYIKQNNVRTVWTLHDCWAFTGQCPYFTMVKCDKWKTCCYDCPQYREYPEALVDRTKTMWKLKRKWFTNVENMTIVTPSQWLADLVKQSFLKDYSVRVIHNGIDLNIFKPTLSSFKERYGITEKHIVLGVAFGWGKRKGLDVFVELSRRLPPEYQIVLVGTDDSTDKLLPDNIISIHRTQNQKELAEIYTAADLLVNPTREENYPTVNMEAIACGTPVLTFRTGGSPEIPDETCGTVVDVDDIDAMESEIVHICEELPYSKEDCLKRAKFFERKNNFNQYISLYANMNGELKR